MFKKSIPIVGISVLIMFLLIGIIYRFEFTWLYVSNVVFFTGFGLFIPGVIITTDAAKIFDSSAYLMRKIFTNPKRARDELQSLEDFLIYRDSENKQLNLKKTGWLLLFLGVLYILIAVVIGTII